MFKGKKIFRMFLLKVLITVPCSVLTLATPRQTERDLAIKELQTKSKENLIEM
jgi:hypothetical protein